MRLLDSCWGGTSSYMVSYVFELHIRVGLTSCRSCTYSVGDLGPESCLDILERRHPARCSLCRMHCSLRVMDHSLCDFQATNQNRIINLFAVKWYGESEFWLSSGKLVLIIMLFCFTFITMVGGNPAHDAYGFRYWKEPVGHSF